MTTSLAISLYVSICLLLYKTRGLFISSGDILLSIISTAKSFAMAVASVLASKKASNARSEESERQREK